MKFLEADYIKRLCIIRKRKIVTLSIKSCLIVFMLATLLCSTAKAYVIASDSTSLSDRYNLVILIDAKFGCCGTWGGELDNINKLVEFIKCMRGARLTIEVLI